MLFLKRLFLVAMVLIVPPLLTAASVVLAAYVLARTHRFVDPQIMRATTAIEYLLFFVIAILEARARWQPHPH